MTSSSNFPSYKNLSFCIYIGNTTSIDDEILLNYCSHFGRILTTSFLKEKFCDFHIIEFTNNDQIQKFLHINNHEIDRIQLDIKSYKHILIHNDILNIDRKFYIGPILNSNDEHLIVQFYKIIDPTLQYYLSKQDNQIYLLFEFNNRQSITTIFEKQTIPIINEHRKFSLVKPIHPKQFVNKIISMKNKYNQINIRGLNDKITETMLIDYFHKRAPVIACHIFSNNLKFAIVEFNDKTTVKKILEIPNVCLHGVNLSLSQLSQHLTSLLYPNDDNETDEDENDILEHISNSSNNKNHTSPNKLLPTNQEDTRQQSLSFIKSTSPPIITEPIIVPSQENNESGWSSPPRTVFTESLSIDRPNPDTTINNIHSDLTSRLTTIDTDVKPTPKCPSNNFLRFAEQFEIELDQIKNEYRSKFEHDQTSIQQEINLLINEERQTFEKLNRYLIDQKRHVEKRNNKNKRKHSPPSSSTQ